MSLFLEIATALLVNVQVIMHLEEQSLDEIMEKSELLVSCYYIIESAVAYMASDRLLLLDQRQRGQLYTALKNGFTSILDFLQELSLTLKEQTYHLEDHQKKYFVCATIRILGECELCDTETVILFNNCSSHQVLGFPRRRWP